MTSKKTMIAGFLAVACVAMATPSLRLRLSRLIAPHAGRQAVAAAVDAGTAANPGRARLTPISLAIAGDIETSAAGASVTVRAGDRTFPATVSGTAFSANLLQIDRGAMISIESNVGGTIYRSLLGTASLAKRQAGADGRLDASENPSLHLSALGTAIHFLTMRELGGRLPTDDDELDRTLRALYTADIPTVANALAKIASGTVPLPSGFGDALALVADRQAFRQFLAANKAALGDEWAYVAGTRGLAFAAADIERNWVLSGRMPLGGIAFQPPAVSLMMRTPSGVALYGGRSRRNAAFVPGVLANGDLFLQAAGTVSDDAVELVALSATAPGSTLTTMRRTTVSEQYKRIFTGGRIALWLQTTNESQAFPDYPGEAVRSRTLSEIDAVGELRTIVAPFSTSNLLGRRAFPTFCLENGLAAGQPLLLSDCEFAEHVMSANGTGVVQSLGQKVDPSLNPAVATGSANVTWQINPDGSARIQGANYSLTLWRLGMSEDVADAMLYLATARDGGDTLAMAGHTIALDGNSPVSYGAADAVGTWKYATFGDERAPYAYTLDLPLVSNTFVRQADGTHAQDVFLDPFDETGASGTYHYRSGWKMIDNSLYETRYRGNVFASALPPNTQYFSSCAAAFAVGATQCVPTRVRVFRPFAKVGNRWYGIENLYSRYSTASYTPPFQFARYTRATYHVPVP